MIIEYAGKRPQLGQNVFVAPTAVIIGDVEIGDGASVWYGVVLRGDEGRIVIGCGSNVQDNSALHTTRDQPTIIKEDVTIGHGALLEGCTVEAGAVVGMGAILLHGVVVGAQAMVAAGSVVTPGTIIPPRALAAGSPAIFKKELSGAALRSVERSAKVYHELSQHYLAQRLDASAPKLIEQESAPLPQENPSALLANFYEGLSEEEIDEIERIILDRRDFFGKDLP